MNEIYERIGKAGKIFNVTTNISITERYKTQQILQKRVFKQSRKQNEKIENKKQIISVEQMKPINEN